MVTSRNPCRIFLRDWTIWLLQFIPWWRRQLQRGPRITSPIRYKHAVGMPFMPELQGGYCFPQTYCVNLVGDQQTSFTDDVIFAPAISHQLFRIVVLLNELHEMQDAVKDLTAVIGSNTQNLSLSGTVFFVPRENLSGSLVKGSDRFAQQLFRSATAEEFAQTDLCKGRPIPRGYDELLMWKASKGKRYLILRPDRFVFAACNSTSELQEAGRNLSNYV